jgi:hypothetical protein
MDMAPPPAPPDFAGTDILLPDMAQPIPDLLGADLLGNDKVPDGGVLQINASTCSGTCNGSRACRYPDKTTNCGSTFCSDVAEVATMSCDGKGSCLQTRTECSQYICGAGACKTMCASQADCLPGDYCDGVSLHCVPVKANGVSCGQPFECTSGYCANGVCCNSECTNTPGGVCNQSGNVGTCVCTAGCAGVGCQLFYQDSDGDGFGNRNGSVAGGTAVVGCTGSPPGGYVADNTDCDDGDGNVHPGQQGFFSTPSKGTGTFDYNCDGNQTHSPIYSGASCELVTGSPFISPGCSTTTTCGTSTAQTGLGIGYCRSTGCTFCLEYCCGAPTQGYIGDATCGQPAQYRWCYACVANGSPGEGTGSVNMACN